MKNIILLSMQEKPLLQSCKNCGNYFEGKYCNKCGEKVYTDHDKSILHFFEEGFHFITHFEGTFFKTLTAIFTKPGLLSDDYTKGIRKKYFKPLSFFMLLVVLYLIFPFPPGLNMKMEYHMYQFPYGDMATALVNKKLASHPGLTLEQLSENFAIKSEKTSKLLLFIIVPLSALPLWLLFKKKRPFFFDSLVLATEINSFFIILLFFIMPLISTINNWISGMLNINYIINDFILDFAGYIVFALVLRNAFCRFFLIRKWQSFAASLLFIAWHILTVFFIYKFILFITVFYQLH